MRYTFSNPECFDGMGLTPLNPIAPSGQPFARLLSNRSSSGAIASLLHDLKREKDATFWIKICDRKWAELK
jgi:hypothetical protein